jgi:hypothetical protein
MIHQSLQLKKKRITFMGCEDQKKRKTESTKILMEKKRKRHDSSSKPTTGYFHFSNENRLKLVVEKAHGVWIPKETYCQGFTSIEVPYFSTRDAMKT